MMEMVLKPSLMSILLGGWSKIILGLNVEKDNDDSNNFSDNIDDFIAQLHNHNCAGLLCWRLRKDYKDAAVKEVFGKVKK